MHLEALTEPFEHADTATAQRFLLGAHDAVDGVLETLEKIRKLRKDETGASRGRLTGNEEDLLRAAVLFTGAGLDATLKQLIRDTLPSLLERNEQAHEKFEKFVRDRIGTGEIADTKMLARYLSAPRPREQLIEDYVYDLTGSSLQSAAEMQKTASALGIDDRQLHKKIQGLRTLFVARNEIAHELDLQQPEGRGDRKRRSRRTQTTKDLCHEGLEVGQLLVNRIGGLL